MYPRQSDNAMSDFVPAFRSDKDWDFVLNATPNFQARHDEVAPAWSSPRHYRARYLAIDADSSKAGNAVNVSAQVLGSEVDIGAGAGVAGPKVGRAGDIVRGME